MHLHFMVTHDPLPDGAAVGLLAGRHEAIFYLRDDATAADIAEALTELVSPWVQQSWLYVGAVPEAARPLRAVGD